MSSSVRFVPFSSGIADAGVWDQLPLGLCICAIVATAVLALLLVPAAARAAGSAYVTSEASSFPFQYTIGADGSLSSLGPASGSGSGSFIAGAVSPNGENYYFAGGGTISLYNIDASTGVLSFVGPQPPGSSTGAFGIAVSPDNTSVYVTEPVNNDVRQYDVDTSTGALTAKTPAVVATDGSGPEGIAITPDGKSAYVTTEGNDLANIASTVEQYDIDPTTGDLTHKNPHTVSPDNRPAGNAHPWGVAVTPDGRTAYVVNNVFNTVSEYEIDQTTGPSHGALTSKGLASTGGNGSFGIAVSRDGQSAYVTNNESNNVSQFSIASTGLLSPKSPSSLVPTDSDPQGVALSTDGNSAYVANIQSGTISQYDVDSGGNLTAKNQATVTVGSGNEEPVDIVVGPQPSAYARPRGATPTRTPLVPAYQQCTSPNATHGGPAPLNTGSCAPPTQVSSHLTVGTPDANGAAANSSGYVQLTVKLNPSPTPNDVLIAVNTTDVRCKTPTNTTCGAANAVSGPDYTGQLEATSMVRLTDKLNGVAANLSGTVQDFAFPATVPCAATASTSVGSTCAVSTSANAIEPGAVKTGKRAIWQLDKVQVYDGGSSGTAGASDATMFEDQGVFVP
jgi:6-phosphogluconolactonase